MQCREHCGACCVAPSINTPFYGMPRGKPAGTPCVHLDQAMRCRLFGDARRPALCADFAPEREICGHSRAQAQSLLARLEVMSAPSGNRGGEPL